MEQRARFVLEAQRGLFSMSELCERFEVSRKTGYKWLERYDREGLVGLEDRSRAALGRPNATDASVLEEILALRRKRPRWGARKLRDRLRTLNPEIAWPAASTIGELLKREGLIAARTRRARSRVVWQRARTEADRPNRVWSADFKGQFRLGDGSLCYPLTIMDGHSRFLLACRSLGSTCGATAREVFDHAFQRYGLPDVIRTDNGTPFSSPTALQGLSRLAVSWIKLGIRLERSRPAHPQDNGSHERMHRTLKDETAKPARRTAGAQQKRFDAFRRDYNTIRPHAALGGITPSASYRVSEREMPREIPELTYPNRFEVRSVTRSGEIKWRQHRIFISVAIANETVGIEEVDDRMHNVYFGPILLGRFPEDQPFLVSAAGT